VSGSKEARSLRRRPRFFHGNREKGKVRAWPFLFLFCARAKQALTLTHTTRPTTSQARTHSVEAHGGHAGRDAFFFPHDRHAALGVGPEWVDDLDMHRQTPLLAAAHKYKGLPIVLYLLDELGADINATDYEDYTATLPPGRRRHRPPRPTAPACSMMLPRTSSCSPSPPS
jgi:hypothetical protein